MKPVKSVSVYIIMGLCVLFFPGCSNTPYNSTAPSAKKLQALVALEEAVPARTSDAKFAYIFSENFVEYNPPCPGGGCGKKFNSPIYSYSIDPTSGMPSLIGIEVDTPPVNTKFIKVSPSDRHLYMLTGDNLIYTFSIGFPIFTEDEFKNQYLKPLGLYNALSKAGYITEAVLSSEDIINQLNALLEQPDLYDQIYANNPNLSETDEIKKLKAETINSRIKLFGDLTESEQKAIIRLNRLMV